VFVSLILHRYFSRCFGVHRLNWRIQLIFCLDTNVCAKVEHEIREQPYIALLIMSFIHVHKISFLL